MGRRTDKKKLKMKRCGRQKRRARQNDLIRKAEIRDDSKNG